MKKRIFVLLWICLAGCKKPENPPSGPAATLQPVSAPTARDEAIVNLLKQIGRVVYQPTTQEIDGYNIKADCSTVDFSRLKIGPVIGNRVVVQAEYVRAMPGFIGCIQNDFLLNFETNKWVLSPLTGRKVLTDLNGDGRVDVLVFRHTHSDGPERVVSQVFMAGPDGALVEKKDPALEKCGSMSDGLLPIVKATGCDLEIQCEQIISAEGYGGDPGVMRYDCQKQAFVIRAQPTK